MIRVSTWLGLTALGTLALATAGYAFPVALLLSAIGSGILSNIDRIPLDTGPSWYIPRRRYYQNHPHVVHHHSTHSLHPTLGTHVSNASPAVTTGQSTLVSTKFKPSTPAVVPASVTPQFSGSKHSGVKPGTTLVSQRFQSATPLSSPQPHTPSAGVRPGSTLVSSHFRPAKPH